MIALVLAAQLTSVTFSQWQKELATMRGHVVVVDYWATWCAPCVSRFPRMLAMAKTWDAKRVRLVTMSLDDRDEKGSFDRVREFLGKHDVSGRNYMMDETIPDAFDKLNLNSVPAVVIYDASGKVRYKLTGDNPNHQFTEADVDAAVKALLGSR